MAADRDHEELGILVLPPGVRLLDAFDGGPRPEILEIAAIDDAIARAGPAFGAVGPTRSDARKASARVGGRRHRGRMPELFEKAMASGKSAPVNRTLPAITRLPRLAGVPL